MRKANYDRRYFEARDVLIPQIANTVRDIMIKNNLRTVLDVGCGTGLLVKYLNSHHFKAIGCDNSQEGVKAAKKANGRKNIIHAKASSLPFKDNSFNLVTSVSVIEHLPQKDALKFILESKRVLNKNGFIFLVTPNLATPLRLLFGKKWFAYQDPTHVNFYTPKTLSRLLTSHGFKNPNTRFINPFGAEIDSQFPPISQKIPTIIKKILIQVLFNSPLSIIRNSIWILAQKK